MGYHSGLKKNREALYVRIWNEFQELLVVEMERGYDLCKKEGKNTYLYTHRQILGKPSAGGRGGTRAFFGGCYPEQDRSLDRSGSELEKDPQCPAPSLHGAMLSSPASVSS